MTQENILKEIIRPWNLTKMALTLGSLMNPFISCMSVESSINASSLSAILGLDLDSSMNNRRPERTNTSQLFSV